MYNFISRVDILKSHVWTFEHLNSKVWGGGALGSHKEKKAPVYRININIEFVLVLIKSK
jgi:hypothetical protein